MKLYMETADREPATPASEKVVTLTKDSALYANLGNADFSLSLTNGSRVYLFGDLFYHIKNNGAIRPLDRNSTSYLKKLFSETALKKLIPCLEGQYVGLLVNSRTNTVQLFSDRYARLDSFYASSGSDFFFAMDLDFIFKNVKAEYDQKMLAHLFSVYGWYTPKGRTIYSNVKQLNVGEVITLSSAGMRSETIAFKPLKTEEYGDRDLEQYHTILRDSVAARADRKGKVWVSSSSGWDSSLILGLLVDELGPKNVGMISGSMKYSEDTAVINKFEIDKIKKIGSFYGIKPSIVDLDYKSKNAGSYWEQVLPYYRSKHNYTFVTYNFSRLSDGLTKAAGSEQVIFNGETSDSFHNFGFSQFATFFHTSKTFTEYADKMNCYLYGPSFFRKVQNNTYERDKVFQIFKKMSGNTEFSSGLSGDALIESYLLPLFYGGPRIPFAKTLGNPALHAKGQAAITAFPYREYMPDILSGMTPENLYSWYIYQYHHLHSQGSTVNVQKHSMELNDHGWRSPFNDLRLIELLSKAPESWGRGLEMNNTKYPLKWVAKNKIKFPYELLQEGPHSYLYDVIEGFSLFAEITYRSGVTDFFKEKLRDRPYRAILTDEYFDLNYLDRLCADYLDGKETTGQDFNNLVSLITLCVTGWY